MICIVYRNKKYHEIISQNFEPVNDIIWKNEFGMAHREDGPAIVWANGDQGWYYCGVRHRKNGPSIEYANGNREWWVRGRRLQTNDRTDFPNEFTAIQDLTPDIGGTPVRIRCRIRRSRCKGKLCFLELEDDFCSVLAILMKSERINRDIL
jgi:hypothetical protein